MRIPIIRIRDKFTGNIRILGTDQHDMLVAEEDGSIGYYNLQNGDGTRDGYEFVTRDAGDGMLELACEWVSVEELQRLMQEDPEHYLTPREMDKRFPEKKAEREKMLREMIDKLDATTDKKTHLHLHIVH